MKVITHNIDVSFNTTFRTYFDPHFQGNKMKFRAILIVLVLSAVNVFAVGRPWDPEPREDANWQRMHEANKQYTEENWDNINALFYGDSITYRWKTTGNETFNEYYAPLGTANYGIGGDRTEHVLYRILNGEVERLNPKVVVLNIGTNNLHVHLDEEIIAGVLTLLDNLTTKLPNTRILLLGILPRTDSSWNARVKNVNEEIQKGADGFRIRWLDMFDIFCKGDDEFVKEYYTQDLIHISSAGYVAWAEAMAVIFDEMIGSI